MDNIVREVLYYPCLMVLGQFSVDLLDLRLKHTVLGVLTSACQQEIFEEIFTGTNFRELVFDHKNCENFCLTKVSHYTVCVYIWLCVHSC